jgi:hypothetical protein
VLRAAAAASDQKDEFREVASEFQKSLAGPLKMQVGFLRDRLNQHELWFIPNSFFPTAPDQNTYVDWSLATARPLKNQLGSDTFTAPDFSKAGYPIIPQTVIDQDFDLLGRVAFTLIENESSDVGVVYYSDECRAHARPTRREGEHCAWIVGVRR